MRREREEKKRSKREGERRIQGDNETRRQGYMGSVLHTWAKQGLVHKYW